MIDREDIYDVYSEENFDFVSPSGYDNVMSFFDEVESYFDEWVEQVAEGFGYDVGEFINEVSQCDECKFYFIGVRDFLMNVYLSPYIDMAMDEFPEAYEWQDDQYYCKVCGKPIEYSGDDSVMLLDDKWYEVLRFYKLQCYEREAQERARDWYEIVDRRGGLRIPAPRNIHTFICNDCIEDALGHPIEPTDINDSPFNQGYIKSHFINK